MLKIVVAKSTDETISAVSLVHNKDKLEWNLNTFDRTKIVNKKEVFATINGYLAKLDPAVQSQMFELYADIYDYIRCSSADVQTVFAHLKGEVNKLVDLLDLDELERYCSYHATFSYPTTLKDQYSENEPKESTYLRSDYHGLLYLATALKMILPIWGELIKRTQREVGSIYKEQLGVTILGHSKLFDRPEMKRLIAYVRDMASKVKVVDTAIYNNIGSEQLPDWLLAQVIIRRLAISETNIPTINLISNIYNFISSTTEKLDSRFNNKVKSKHRPKDVGGEEDNISLAENYKIKQDVADNYIVGYEVWLRDYAKVAAMILPSIDQNMVKQCVEFIEASDPMEFEDWHMQFMSLMVGRVISPRALPSLSYSALVRILGITQAILLTLGFEDLAHLMTSRSAPIPMDILRGDGNKGAERSRLTPANKERLIEIYPHYKVKSNAQKEKDIVPLLPPVIWIESVNKETQGLDWTLHSPIQPSNESYKNGRPWMIPKDIKIQLAELIIMVKGEGVLNDHQPTAS